MNKKFSPKINIQPRGTNAAWKRLGENQKEEAQETPPIKKPGQSKKEMRMTDNREVLQAKSEKKNISLRPTTHDTLKKEADKLNLSVNELIHNILDDRIKSEELEMPPPSSTGERVEVKSDKKMILLRPATLKEISDQVDLHKTSFNEFVHRLLDDYLNSQGKK